MWQPLFLKRGCGHFCVWSTLRLVFRTRGLKPDRVQICARLKSTTSTASAPKLFCFWLNRILGLLHRSSPHLKFTITIAFALQLFFFCLNRILTFWFLFLAGSLSQPFASSLGPWENILTSEPVRLPSTGEIKAPVHGRGGFVQLMTSVKTLLDMMHRHCPGFVMVIVGMAVDIVVGDWSSFMHHFIVSSPRGGWIGDG